MGVRPMIHPMYSAVIMDNDNEVSGYVTFRLIRLDRLPSYASTNDSRYVDIIPLA